MSESVIVLGAHRSGTSLLNGSLGLAGYFAGDNLLPANKGNPKGYFEDKDIVTINDQILSSFNSRWDDTRPMPIDWQVKPNLFPMHQILDAKITDLLKSSKKLSLKDPRICLTLPFWQMSFERLNISSHLLVLFRQPEQSIYSLMLRDKTSFSQSALIWLKYNVYLMCFLEDKEYHAIQFDNFCQQPFATLEAIPFVETEHLKEDAANEFFDRSLIRANQLPEELKLSFSDNEKKLLDLCNTAYEKFEEREHEWFKSLKSQFEISYTLYNREIDQALHRQFLKPNSVENLQEQIEVNRLRLELEEIVVKINSLKNENNK